MNISVRVLSAQAQGQIKALQAQVAMLQKQLAAANATSATGILGGGAAAARSRKSLTAWGSQVQWAGRQIRYNFTAPLLLAGGIAMKFALDNERAMTRVNKVYGDRAAAEEWARKHTDKWAEGATSAVEHVRIAFENETKALGEAFEALSSHYGVQQKQVIEVAGAWAAAGASGRALAESTELSLQAATLGEMDLAKATESLIAIQSQYGLSTKGLNLALAELNAIENQTGISMQGLIDGFARSAGVAREAGVDVRHLGAMLAALVPATGTAATAGNALKTIISRLMSPTGDAADVMKEFGVNTQEAAWQSSTAMERLLILAGHMGDTLKTTGDKTADTADDMYKLSDSQKQVVASVLGSRYQMNRFLVLMRELGPANSYYEKALSATADRQAVFAQKQRELNAVLESSPKRLEILWYTMQNGMADAIQPMIPYLLYMVSLISRAVTAFSNLSPEAQKFFFVLALGIASIGIFMPLIGTTAVLIGYVGTAFKTALVFGLRFFFMQRTVTLGNKVLSASLWSVTAALIAMPFRAVAAAVGFFIGKMLMIPAVAAGVNILSKAFILMGASAGAGIALMFKIFSAPFLIRALAGIAASVYAVAAHLVVVWTGALTAMVGRWFAAWGAMGTASVMMRLIANLNVVLFIMQRLMGAALLNMVALVFVGFEKIGAAMIAVWSRIQPAFMAVMIGMQTAFYAVWSAFATVAAAGWASVHIIATSVAAATGRAVIAIQVAMHRALLAIQAAWVTASAALQRAWAAVSAGITAVWGRVTAALWVAYTQGLLLLQRAWAIVSINIQWAWAIAYQSVMVALRTTAVAIWGSMLAAKAAMSAAFWSRIIAMYIAAAVNLRKIMTAIGVILTGPWGVALAAAVILIVAFREQLVQIWNNIVSYFSDSNNAVVQGIISAWNALPQGVANALTAVARIVQQAAMQIYEWFSYINPFARHSPSLVENVKKGMESVNKDFATFKNVGGHVKSAYAAIKAFKNAAGGLISTGARLELAEDIKQIAKVAPGAVDEFKKLAGHLRQLESDLAQIEVRMNAQQAIVDKWQARVDTLNYRLNMQQYILDQLSKKQQKYQDLLDEAAGRLEYFSTVGIAGQQAMSDAIFDNEMAQKRLRLEMMRMEEVNGSLDDIKGKIEAINGAQEVLRGTQASLRGKGAGSEILSGYQDQIDLLEEQKKAYQDAAGPLQSVTNQLDELQRKGEELDLVNSLQFDPLRRQIEQAANAMEELPFDQIMQGVRGARADMEKYQEQLDAATAAVDAQQAVVDRLTEARDRLQHRLDQEQRKLDLIKNRYDQVNDAISDVKSTMDLATQAAGKLGEKLEKAAKKAKGVGSVSPAVQNFRDAAGGNFANVGGDGIPMRMNWEDQSGKIKDFTKDLANDTAKVFEDLNPFTWIQKKWASFKGWWGGVWSELKRIGSDFFGSIFSGVGGGGGIDFGGMKAKIVAFLNVFRGMWEDTKDFMSDALSVAKKVWDLFWPDIKESAEAVGKALVAVWEKIGPEFSKLWKEIKEFGPALKGLFNIIKVALAVTLVPFIGVLKILFNMFAKMIGPVIEWLGDILAGLLRAFRGVFQFVSGFLALFSGDFETAFKKMGAGIGNIFGALWDMIWSTLKNAFKMILGGVWGFIESIWDFFNWLWDELVGHSIIPDIIEGIQFWFGKLIQLATWLWNNVIQPVFKLFAKLLPGIVLLFRAWWAGVTLAWSALRALAVWLWDNVLKPVWDQVVKLWPVVKLAFMGWWAGIKLAWAALTTAATWMWEHVLKPIWDSVVYLWQKVKPELSKWWDRVKRAWNGLKRAGNWVWENVLKPVWNKIVDLWQRAKPELSKWWDRVKQAWNSLKSAAIWVWENVLKPVWNKIVDLWNKVKPELEKWRSRLERAWDKLKSIGNWIKQNVMDPVFNAIKNGWTRVKEWLEDSKDLLTGPVKGIMGSVRTVMNTVINGLNKVSDMLPGIDFHINPIAEFAQGGGLPMPRRVGGGFKTNGARAIVGEGKANHPEFVIPTDPTYRNRARGLLAMAAAKLGVANGVNSRGAMGDTVKDIQRVAANNPKAAAGAIPQYGIGGWIDDKWDDVKDMADKLRDQIEKLGKNAIGKIMNPLLDVADNKIKDQNWDPVESLGLYATGKLRDWTRDSDSNLNEFVEKADEYGSEAGGPKIRAALQWARSQAGKPYVWGGVGPDGYDCSGFMSAITNHIRGNSIHSRVGSTGTFPWSGFKPGAMPRGFTIGSTTSYAGGVGHMAGTLGGVNVESAGGVGVRIGRSARGYGSSGFTTVYHLANGAFVKGGQGGVFARIGEGSQDELVTPLPRNWKADSLGGETHLHFHGATLSFPNIKSADDAEQFIENLKNLADD